MKNLDGGLATGNDCRFAKVNNGELWSGNRRCDGCDMWFSLVFDVRAGLEIGEESSNVTKG